MTTLAIRVPALRVKEVDGAPDVLGVETITVSNGSLTDDGAGAVTLVTGAAASSLTVKEEDAAPSVANVTEIRVSNGTLTDNGGGSVSINIAGGGAPATSTYWVEDADGGLSNEVVVGTTGITTAAYGSRQAAAKAGRLFLPNNGFYLERDTGAAWASWGPIFQCTPLVSGDYAWVNQGGATIATTSGATSILGVAEAGPQVRLMKKAKSATFTITAHIIPNSPQADFNQVGVCWRQSSDGKLVAFGLQCNAATPSGVRLTVDKWNTESSYSAAYATLNIPATNRLFLRISDTLAGNRVCSYSIDGITFTTVHTVGRTDFLTGDEVGFYVIGQSASSASSMTIISWLEA